MTKQTLNTYQVEDMAVRQHDAYAHAKYEILVDWLETFAKTPVHILNAGCGSGELSFLLSSVGHYVRGIDPSAEFIQLAREQAQQLGTVSCEFEVAALEEHAYSHPAHYDCVMATDVLEHIEDDRSAIVALSQLLKPGGNLYVTVPAGQYLYGYHDEQLGHRRRYSLRRLSAILPDDLQVVRLRYFGMSLIPIAWLYSQVLRRPYPVAEMGDRESSPFLSRLLGVVLTVEKRIHSPVGTSCLLWARKLDSRC